MALNGVARLDTVTLNSGSMLGFYFEGQQQEKPISRRLAFGKTPRIGASWPSRNRIVNMYTTVQAFIFIDYLALDPCTLNLCNMRRSQLKKKIVLHFLL